VDHDTCDHYDVTTSRTIRNIHDGWHVIVRGADQLLSLTYIETHDDALPGQQVTICVPPYAARQVAKALIELADMAESG
jgi:hypothetical protein